MRSMLLPLLEAEEEVEDRWARLLPELLGEIVRRVEESEERWPRRRNVVACAAVCRRWREVTVGIVRPPLDCGKITFPLSLKQPGTKELPFHCFIRRNTKTATFNLYLSLTQTFLDKGKFLLAARRIRHGAYTEYIISLDADDISQGSNAYVGKLSSDFLGTKFTIYDSQPPFCGAKASSNRSYSRFGSKRISPQISAGSFVIGHVSYKINLLRSRGPRRMICSLQNLSTKESKKEICPIHDKQKPSSGYESIVLKNNAPRWHEHLKCWCLNFHGRVTVASVKNFQLAVESPATEHGQTGTSGEEEPVILQFGKIGDDMFTMDYRHPLSAFQAFAICLTSFGTKLGCE